MASTETHFTPPLPDLPGNQRVLIVRAPYYLDVADKLRAGAEAALAGAGVASECLDVPGALEIPSAIALAANGGGFDGYVALGCIIRGETTHYDTVCNDSSRGLMLLGLQGLCIGNGILTVENTDQAEARANPDKQNKGAGAALAALHLIAARHRFAPGADATPGRSFQAQSEHITIAGGD